MKHLAIVAGTAVAVSTIYLVGYYRGMKAGIGIALEELRKALAAELLEMRKLLMQEEGDYPRYLS